jgi:hypothetical protein
MLTRRSNIGSLVMFRIVSPVKRYSIQHLRTPSSSSGLLRLVRQNAGHELPFVPSDDMVAQMDMEDDRGDRDDVDRWIRSGEVLWMGFIIDV